MNPTHKSPVYSETPVASMVMENPALLLVFEHFGMENAFQGKTVAQACEACHTSEKVFLLAANLVNGYPPVNVPELNSFEISIVIAFLKNAHAYYRSEKYPEIRTLIEEMIGRNPSEAVRLTGGFFEEYYQEVIEHIDYEDQVAFPYFFSLTGNNLYKAGESRLSYSSAEYREHHTDIETKLTDLKHLLLLHIPVSHDLDIRRKLLVSLFAFEQDMLIHRQIEEEILVPQIERLENGRM